MKIAILKLSGKAIESFVGKTEWLNIITGLRNHYDGLIIVHGAGNQISEWSNSLGYEVNFVNGQRVTDESVVGVAAAVQSGLINGKIIAHLCSKGMNAVGLTGIDNNLFVADYLDERLGFVGVPKQHKDIKVNINWLKHLMDAGIIPVFSSICRDKNGNLMNVNADVFTNTLASALQAETVFFISDVSGVMLNGKTLKQIDEKEIEKGIRNKEITGGMIPKLQSCVSLLNSGVHKIWIGNDLSHSFPYNLQHKHEGTWIVTAD
jgi:acetylglutamate kinase